MHLSGHQRVVWLVHVQGLSFVLQTGFDLCNLNGILCAVLHCNFLVFMAFEVGPALGNLLLHAFRGLWARLFGLQMQVLQALHQVNVVCVLQALRTQLALVLVGKNVAACLLVFGFLLVQDPFLELAYLLQTRTHFHCAFSFFLSLFEVKTLNYDVVELSEFQALVLQRIELALETLHRVEVGHLDFLKLLLSQSKVALNHHSNLSDVETAKVSLPDFVEGLLEIELIHLSRVVLEPEHGVDSFSDEAALIRAVVPGLVLGPQVPELLLVGSSVRNHVDFELASHAFTQ